ncbi:hypothetical protein BBF96_04630 [Anoxybacter fermentans]|uniref:tRNA(Met) cytidine acetate ligase n=1 Tax=Anoxybacter fermentans TaxID=1323375 RepID=A0A3S9SWQ9_9FIRM|nr:nucleotidyltransferase [Anoxybacter fermentans]AZR72739.1 hypothetical protein BBF96_04630 [Anoxybacter fermentans]
MKILGIIAEYNPFHNGHQYHLKESKTLIQADGVVCVLSSNFLQRGEPALVDKWERTKMALAGGADLVIELPMPYALRSAEFFAYGAVSLLNATGVVDYISFGSEAGNLNKLNQIARILANEPEEFTRLLGNHLSKGLSYPDARTRALIDYFKQTDTEISLDQNEVKFLTSNPNNILGLEYLKAIHRLESKLIPITIPRKGAGYHDKKIEGEIASATAIRKILSEKWRNGDELLDKEILKTMPESSCNILRSAFSKGKGPIFIDDFSLQILTLLRRAKTEEIANLFDVRGGLENRIKEAAEQATSIHDLIERIKTKRYTWTRIQRILFHFLLNLTSLECEYFDQLGGPQYIRVLGFTPRGQHILAKMKNLARLPIITRVASYYNRPETPEPINRMLELEILTTNLYSLAMPNPVYRRSNRDLLEKIIIWK